MNNTDFNVILFYSLNSVLKTELKHAVVVPETTQSEYKRKNKQNFNINIVC